MRVVRKIFSISSVWSDHDSPILRNADDVLAATQCDLLALLDEDGFATPNTHSTTVPTTCSRRRPRRPRAQLELFTFNASNSHILNTWATKYEVIQRANALLINAPKVTMDDALRRRCMGEAYS